MPTMPSSAESWMPPPSPSCSDGRPPPRCSRPRPATAPSSTSTCQAATSASSLPPDASRAPPGPSYAPPSMEIRTAAAPSSSSRSGKELIARAIHVGSQRSAATFLPYNCTTTGRDLADSQLFGHKRGSFTGAVSDQPGLVRTAAGGTLFLDEIGDLPLDVQPKLLRFLEQQEIMPIGETKPQKVDVRVLAATNADLEQRVAEGKFREDLYYRLSVIRIHVPPLRQRQEEIPHLSAYFLREAIEPLPQPDIHLSSETLDVFSQYWWPGNIRQLKNEIQQAVALSAPGGMVEPVHTSPKF